MTSVSDISQRQWLKACRKLGLKVDTKKGKGSHARIYHPERKDVPPTTIAYHTNPIINRKIIKYLKDTYKFTDREINDALK